MFVIKSNRRPHERKRGKTVSQWRRGSAGQLAVFMPEDTTRFGGSDEALEDRSSGYAKGGRQGDTESTVKGAISMTGTVVSIG